MDIKSFKPRQTVYIVGDERRENGFGKRTTGICRISLRKQSMAHRVSCSRRRTLYASTKNVRN